MLRECPVLSGKNGIGCSFMCSWYWLFKKKITTSVLGFWSSDRKLIPVHLDRLITKVPPRSK
jgi:hypothetical protein